MPRAHEHEGLPVNRPFLCGRCGLWYTVLPFEPWDVCDRARHSDSADCHYNHSPSTESERILGEALAACIQARDGLANAVAQGSKGARLQAIMDAMNVALAKVPNALAMASVTQLPGRGDSEDRGLMSLQGIRTLAAMNRRPQEEVDRAERSERICKAMAMEIPDIAKEANRLFELFQAPPLSGPTPPAQEMKAPEKKDPWAAARAARQAKIAARKAKEPVAA